MWVTLAYFFGPVGFFALLLAAAWVACLVARDVVEWLDERARRKARKAEPR